MISITIAAPHHENVDLMYWRQSAVTPLGRIKSPSPWKYHRATLPGKGDLGNDAWAG
jgi:hypothetical protein